MKIRKAGLVVVGILLIVLFIFNRKDVELSRQDEFILHPISASGGELQSVIHLNNPNLLSSTIKTIHEDFYLNGILLGTLDNQLNQGIPGRKETEFPVNIRFINEDYRKAISGDSLNAARAVVTVTGKIVFDNLMSGGHIEVHQQGSISK